MDSVPPLIQGSIRNYTKRVSFLHGIVPPVVTPQTEDILDDVAAVGRVVRHLIDGGAHGLFILGSSSEVAFLDKVRRAELPARTRWPHRRAALLLLTCWLAAHLNSRSGAGHQSSTVSQFDGAAKLVGWFSTFGFRGCIGNNASDSRTGDGICPNWIWGARLHARRAQRMARRHRDSGARAAPHRGSNARDVRCSSGAPSL